jgi:hypothetical protein
MGEVRREIRLSFFSAYFPSLAVHSSCWPRGTPAPVVAAVGIVERYFFRMPIRKMDSLLSGAAWSDLHCDGRSGFSWVDLAFFSFWTFCVVCEVSPFFVALASPLR